MKICHYNNNQAGSIVGDQVYPIGEALVKAGHLRAGYTMREVVDALANKPAAMAVARDHTGAGKPLPLASVKLLAPITDPGDIWCAASNYKAHQEEMLERVKTVDVRELLQGRPDGGALPQADQLDHRARRQRGAQPGLQARRLRVRAVRGSRQADAQRDGRQALDYVFGYTMLWDLSQRDPWGIGRQNTRAIRKGFDTFTGLGPWIVTADEIPNPHDLNFKVEQNGKVVMTAYTGDMVANLHDLFRFLSHAVTLRPGTLLTTGTPAGVQRLAPGDKLKGTMDKIGVMELNVVAQK